MQTALIAERASFGKRPTSFLATRHAAFERGRDRWASLGLSYEQFAAHLDRLGWTQALPHDIAAFYLCAACCMGLPRACRELDRAYFPGLMVSLSMRYQRPDFIEDVLQLTRERLLVKPSLRIATYRGTGCLQSWLRVIAQRLALDLHRSENGQKRRAVAEWQQSRAFHRDAELPADLDCETLGTVWIGSLEGALFEALAKLHARDRRLLDLYYVHGVQAEDIAACLGVDRSTVYRRLQEVQRRVESSVRRALRSRTARLTPEEFRALVLARCVRVGLGHSILDAVRS